MTHPRLKRLIDSVLAGCKDEGFRLMLATAMQLAWDERGRSDRADDEDREFEEKHGPRYI